MKRIFQFAAIVSMVLSTQAFSASLVESSFKGEAQQNMDGGAITMCGVHIYGAEKAANNDAPKLLGFNGSINVYMGAGVVKGKASIVDFDPARKLSDRVRIVPQKTENIWMKAPGKKATTPLEHSPMRESVDKGFLIYGADIDEAFPVVLAILRKSPIQISLKRSGIRDASIMFGVVEMSDAQTMQLDACIRELYEIDKDDK